MRHDDSITGGGALTCLSQHAEHKQAFAALPALVCDMTLGLGFDCYGPSCTGCTGTCANHTYV